MAGRFVGWDGRRVGGGLDGLMKKVEFGGLIRENSWELCGLWGEMFWRRVEVEGARMARKSTSFT